VSEYEEGPIGQVKDELKSLEEFIPPAALPETVIILSPFQDFLRINPRFYRA
jgi:hypothetical protein